MENQYSCWRSTRAPQKSKSGPPPRACRLLTWIRASNTPHPAESEGENPASGDHPALRKLPRSCATLWSQIGVEDRPNSTLHACAQIAIGVGAPGRRSDSACAKSQHTHEMHDAYPPTLTHPRSWIFHIASSPTHYFLAPETYTRDSLS